VTFPVIDTIRNLTDADIAQLKSLGVTGVSRYIARTSSIGKIMKADECRRIVASGLGLMVNYEQSAGDWQGGYSRGVLDGQWARSYVRGTLGLPDSVVIIQSIDTSVLTAQLAIAADYQRGFNDGGGLGAQGVYGPRNVLEHLHAAGLVRVCWEWMGFAGAASSSVTNIRQYRDKPYPQLPFTYDSNTPITPFYGQYTGQATGDDVPFSTDDVNVLREIAKETVKQVLDGVGPKVWDGYPILGTDYAGSVYLKGSHDYAAQALTATQSVSTKLDSLTVPGGDEAALRQIVREEVDAALAELRLGTIVPT
jgi:hypothetical protein